MMLPGHLTEQIRAMTLLLKVSRFPMEAIQAGPCRLGIGPTAEGNENHS